MTDTLTMERQWIKLTDVIKMDGKKVWALDRCGIGTRLILIEYISNDRKAAMYGGSWEEYESSWCDGDGYDQQREWVLPFDAVPPLPTPPGDK